MNTKDFETTVIEEIDKSATELEDDKQESGGAASESSGTDAMDSASMKRSDSETKKGKTYNYQTVQPTVNDWHADHLNEDTGLLESLSPSSKGKSSLMLPWSENKCARYVSKGAVDKEVGDTPAFEELVGTDSKAKVCFKMQGTVEDPNEINSIITNNIYIDGGVHEEDIRQGGIGDCYFLAALLQVLRHDASMIPNIMSLNGNTVTSTFYRRETVTENKNGKSETVTRWVQQSVDVNYGILKQNGNIKSSHYRIAYDPKAARWSSEIEGRTLKINREHMYEAAMWVACIEQAYMIFAQKYGQYGMGVEQDKIGTDLVDGIEGGQAQNCMYLFFGDKVTSATARLANNGQDGDIVQDNKWIIQQLLNFANTVDSAGNSDTYLMAGTDIKSAAKRLIYYSQNVENELKPSVGSNANLAKAVSDIQTIVSYASKYEKATDAQIRTYGVKIDECSRSLMKNTDFQNLKLSSYGTMQEAMGVVVQRVTNDPEKYNNIFIYSSHAYSVMDVSLVDSKGASVNGLPIDQVLTSLDASESTVTMINPHAKTKPSIEKEEERFNDGKFTVSLTSFLNNIGYLRSATVKH